MKFLRRIALICFLASQLGFAQATSGIRGSVSVTMQEGGTTYLQGIALSLQCKKTPDQVAGAITDEAGRYFFPNLAPDHCQLQVASDQFEEQNAPVEIVAGQVLEHNFQLHIRQVQQSVSVTAAEEVMAIDTTIVSSSAPAVTQAIMQSAPLSSDHFQDALPLIPGVVRGPDGLMDIKGGRPDQSLTLVNSVSAADPVTGKEAISLPLEAVESVKVLPTPFSAEYGSFSSAVTEVETRSGTDKWKVMFTNFFPRPRRRAGTIMGLSAFTPRLTFAGPLVKDKLFIFQSFDYRYERTSVPSLPELQHDQTFETFNASTQLDWNLSQKNHLSGNFVWYPEDVKYAELNTFLPQESNPNFRRRGFLTSLNDRAIFGTSFLDSSFSVKRYDAHIFPASGELGTLSLYPEQDFGNWFNRQDRNSWLGQWSEVYRKGNLHLHGEHSILLGYTLSFQRYDGEIDNQPVLVLREDHTVSQQITYGNPAGLNAKSEQFSFYAQDHWVLTPRFAFDTGVRFDHDSLSEETLNVAPRIGFVYALTRDNKTALRGGTGLFYDKIPLSTATFMRYPAETVESFLADGVTPAGSPVYYAHQISAPGLRNPRSVAWNLQLERELSSRLLLRLGYDERHTDHDYLVAPIQPVSAPASLQLQSNGSELYRDVEATLRWQINHRSRLYTSFIHSFAHGDLNSYGQYFGDFPNPVIRANQYGPLPHDTPERFLAWGNFGMPWKVELWPVLDIHSGFPFSRVDDDLNFVGHRNTQRYPAFASLDMQAVRQCRISMFRHKVDSKIGVKVFNITGHSNLRDVQNNIASPDYGRLYNNVGRQFRGKLEFDF